MTGRIAESEVVHNLYCDKGVEGVAFASLFQNIPIHSPIFKFYAAEGVDFNYNTQKCL